MNKSEPEKNQDAGKESQERKMQVLTQGTASVTRSIADAVVIKDGDLYFLSEPNGSVSLGGNHGFGLYYHDSRYLNGYTLKIYGSELNTLVANAAEGFSSVFEMTNPEIRSGSVHIGRDTVGVTWEHLVAGDDRVLYDRLTLRNYSLEPVDLELSLTFEADFNPVFAIRGLLSMRPGELHEPAWDDGVLNFLYAGADDLYRSLNVHFWPKPEKTEGTTAHFRLTLDPRESRELDVALVVDEKPERDASRPQPREAPAFESIEAEIWKRVRGWHEEYTGVHSDSVLLNSVMTRSLEDLQILKTEIEGGKFFAAGVPWFVTLFGRDSLITSLQVLSYRVDVAEETLRMLARYQGEQVDEWHDEQPGKILHELRIGELARLNEIPHTPYYGAIDTTPLFLILIGEHANWTGSLELFEDLRKNVERALAWIDEYGDVDGDGYVEYASPVGERLINQGWKDSGNALVDDEGHLATPPIALVEVQGYVYMAKQLMADLYERAGDAERAEALRAGAEALRERFNRDFWMEDLGCYTLALEDDNRPLRVISSNPGHALWTGIAEPEKARRTMERLMQEDMFNGWGVRTLSEKERRYNPIGYHLGTVWPHDNAIVAAGFRRYKFDDAAMTIFEGIADAAMAFDAYRLPELFAGFRKEEYGTPVHYPVACHPQAWCAGAIPYMVRNLLGLAPEAFEKRLRIVHPRLPPFADWIEVRGLRVGESVLDLDFERASDGSTAVNVKRVEGDVDVIISPEEPG